MQPTPAFISVFHLSAAAGVSERTTRRVLREIFPTHPPKFRWQIEPHQASEVVARIQGERKRNRPNQFNRHQEQTQ